MSIRTLLAPLFGSPADALALDAGLRLAGRFEAHLTALFVAIDPRDAIPIVGEGVSPAIIEQLVQATQAEMDRQRATAKAAFEAACTNAKVALADEPPGSRVASAGWNEAVGRRDEIVPRRARASDLVVFGRGKDDPFVDFRAVFEATLFGSGRPLLLVPGVSATLGERVAIAWNGSAEAARAVAGAVPILDRARSVEVLVARTRRATPEVADELLAYLKWRGVAAAARTVEPGDAAVGEVLLQAARDAGADLLVMGGYGRTRLSELVLGGVTRHVLDAPTLPVLIAH